MVRRCFLVWLSLFLILGVNSGFAQQVEHLVAAYLFDESSGDEVIDASGNENHGILQGGIKRVDGRFGRGLQFNGKDAFVEIPDSETLALTTGLTIAMWGFWNSYSTAGGVGVTKERAYKAGVRDHKKMMIRFSTPAVDWNNVVDGTTEVPLGEWHHVAATYDAASGDAVVYYDGKEDGRGSFQGEIVVNTEAVWIGRGLNPYFDGIYDEVALWNVALTESEITSVMQKGLKQVLAVSPGGKLATVWGHIKAVP